MTQISRRKILILSASAPLALALASTARAGSGATTHDVTIQGMAFVPANLTIAVGDTVRFTNLDGAPHTATSTAAGLDTGRLSRGQVGELTFANAGTFPYVCAIHGSMRGTITVT